jgi:hypothetical protein
MNMKRFACIAIFLPSVTAMTFAQATRQIGAWSIYTPSQGNKGTVMLQTSAIPQDGETKDSSEAATLDVLCKNNKVVAIALHTTSGVDKSAVSYTGAVPTIPINFSAAGQTTHSQSWAVSEGGHTLSPFSEAFQGKLNRQWLEHLNGAERVSFAVRGSETLKLQPAFNTEQLGAALSSAGCHP